MRMTTTANSNSGRLLNDSGSLIGSRPRRHNANAKSNNARTASVSSSRNATVQTAGLPDSRSIGKTTLRGPGGVVIATSKAGNTNQRS